MPLVRLAGNRISDRSKDKARPIYGRLDGGFGAHPHGRGAAGNMQLVVRGVVALQRVMPLASEAQRTCGLWVDDLN